MNDCNFFLCIMTLNSSICLLLLKVYAGFRRLKSGEVLTSVISTTSDCVGSQIREGSSEQTRTTEHVNYFNGHRIYRDQRTTVHWGEFIPTLYPFCYFTSCRLDVWMFGFKKNCHILITFHNDYLARVTRVSQIFWPLNSLIV
jgi:hypothetical protein